MLCGRGVWLAQFIVEVVHQFDGGFIPAYVEQPLIQPQETLQAELAVFGVKWKETGAQNLILEIKETTLVGRVFRLSF